MWENPFQTQAQQAAIINGWLEELAVKVALATDPDDIEYMATEREVLISIRDESNGQFHLYKDGRIGLTEWVIQSS